MIILIVTDDYFNDTNGLCISTHRFVEALRAKGLDVRVMANCKNGDPDYPLSPFKVPFFSGIIEKEGFTFAATDKKLLKSAVEWADIVHIEEGFPLSYEAAKLAKAMEKRSFGTFHLFPENMTISAGLGGQRWLESALWALFRRSYDLCNTVICPTELVKAELSHRGYKSKKIVISNGISGEWLKLARTEKIAGSGDSIVILSVGRFSPEKRQSELLEAVRLSKYAGMIQVILAGKGPLERKLRELGSTLPVAPQIDYFSQEELRKTALCSDIYVHCAFVEVEGMSCMECFAAGCVPIIADAPLSSTAKYARSTQSLYPSGDVRVLSERIDYWIEHGDERAQASAQYMEFASSLSLDHSVEALISVYSRSMST